METKLSNNTENLQVKNFEKSNVEWKIISFLFFLLCSSMGMNAHVKLENAIH